MLCYEQLEDTTVERRTMLRCEDNRYVIERTVKHAEVLTKWTTVVRVYLLSVCFEPHVSW